MPDIPDGESVEVKGSARLPYVLRNVGGVYSCTCPAWRNQSIAIERRTCKHLRAYRGEATEKARIGDAMPPPARPDAATDKGPSLLLAHSWDNDLDLSGWWLSEKLDGVRAYWDGQGFLSRQGNKFHAPDWFTAGLPEAPLDGELWLARKAFQRTVSIVRRQDKSDHWRDIRYVVFDMPAVEAPFEERLAELQDRLRNNATIYALAHEHALCRGLDHLQEELARVEAVGGEGLMLRQPGSRYEAGRSATLLKVKTFHDAEAKVVEHLPGSGRHKGRLGALAVELPDGTAFSVGTGFSDREREHPPPIGSTVTFRYQELSDRGVPRFPSFVRISTEASERSAPEANSAEPARKSPAGVWGGEKSASPAPASIVASKAAVGSGDGDSAVRRFEFVEGSSAKFWEVSVTGNDVTVRFGRLGTEGREQSKSFANADQAQAHAEKLVQEKTGKGYVECSR